jgi:phage terminase small subunit
MPRPRSPNRKKAHEIWLASGGKLSNKEIGKQLGVSADMVGKWKRQDNWEQKRPNKTTKPKRRKTTKQPEQPDKENTTATETEAQKQAESFHVLYEDVLTNKQRLFCIYYINSFNATLSYKRAYQCRYGTAAVNACGLLKKPNIREYIDHLKEIRYQSMMIQGLDVIELYMRIAFANINQHIVVKDGRVVLADSEDIDGQIVQEIKETKNGVSIRLNDRMKALQWLSDYFELNPSDQHKRDYDDRMADLKEKSIKLKEW